MEIKSFSGASLISEFHTTLGQFLNYRLVLENLEPQRNLYLAVPHEIYLEFLSLPFPQLAIQRYAIKLLTYDADEEAIILWQS